MRIGHIRPVTRRGPAQAVSQLDVLLDGIITILNTLSLGFVNFLSLYELRQSQAAFKVNSNDIDFGGN